jgi:hypothetical protein
LNRSIQLALKSEGIIPILQKAKAVAKFFRKSPAAALELERQLVISKESKKKLKLENKTQWSSCCKMLIRLRKSMIAVTAALQVLHENQGTRKVPPPSLTNSEWITVSDIIGLLLPLHHATKVISSQSAPTINQVMPMMVEILFTKLVPSEDDAAATASFKRVLGSDLTERWGTIIASIPDRLLLAVYLDPHMKDFAFLADGTSLAIKARDIAFKKLEPLVGTISTPPPSQYPQMTTKEKEAAIALYGAHLVNRAVASLPVVTPSPSTGLQLLRQEVVHYHARPPLDLCHKVKLPLIGGRLMQKSTHSWPNWPNNSSVSQPLQCPVSVCSPREGGLSANAAAH